MARVLILILIFCTLCKLEMEAQLNEPESISITVAVNSKYDSIGVGLSAKLHNKLVRVVTKNGLSSAAIDNNFVLYPSIDIYEQSTVTGMQNITVINGELVLIIQQLDNGVIFSSDAFKFSGSGSSYKSSFSNAISQMPLSNKRLTDFIQDARVRIINYYKDNCQKIVAEAQLQKNLERYDLAISKLMSIPQLDTPCDNQVNELTYEYYLKYQDKYCYQEMKAAEAACSIKDFETARKHLLNIDPYSSCKDSLSVLQAKISEGFDEVERQKMAREMEELRSKTSIEIARQRAKAISCKCNKIASKNQNGKYQSVSNWPEFLTK